MERVPKEKNVLVQAIEKKQWDEVVRLASPELINTYDVDGSTPLMRAARYSTPEKVLIKIIENASEECVKQKDRFGLTILHHLPLLSRSSALRRVLAVNSDNVNALSTLNEWTPLHVCLYAVGRSFEEQRETVKILMEFGAMPTILDNAGDTPIDLYKRNRCSEYDENLKSKQKKELLKILEDFNELIPEEIIARGSKAIKSYMNELQKGETTMVNSRIMLLGKEGAGKTSTVNAILGKKLNKDEPSTDGIVTTTVVQNVGTDYWDEQNVDVHGLAKEIHDHAVAKNVAKELKNLQSTSEESTILESAADNQTSIKAGIIQTSSVKNIASPMNNKKSRENSDKKGIQTTDPKMTDNIIRQAVTRDPKMPDNIYRQVVGLLSGSVIEGPNDITSIWDYAGQPIYYISHRFYLTRRCAYCVVLSLLDKLDGIAKPRHGLPGKLEITNLEMVVFFIRSIYEHAVLPYGKEKKLFIEGKIDLPPIMLVATHKDKLTGTEAEKQIEIEKIFSTIKDRIKKMPYRNHVDCKMYAIDNNNPLDEEIRRLKQNAGEYMNDMAETVPICWVKFQVMILEASKTTIRMSLVDITKMAVVCGILEDNIFIVLQYLTDVGVILYSNKNEKLKDTVILNLHEMIDMMRSIITVVKASNISSILMDSWDKLDEKGILEEPLLCHLWKDKMQEDSSNLDVFVEVMKLFGLIFEKRAVQGNRIFLVPSRMQRTTESLEVKKDDKQTVSVYVTPTDFLPDSVYNVLVVGMLELMEEKGRSTDSDFVKLYQNRSDFDLYEDHNVRLGAVRIENKHALKLEISLLMGNDDEIGAKTSNGPQRTVCLEILKYLRKQLETVYGTMENIGYELYVCCDGCQPNNRSMHKLNKCLSSGRIRCGEIMQTTTRFKTLFAEDHEEGPSAPKRRRMTTTAAGQRVTQLTDDIGEVSHQTDRRSNVKGLFRKFLAELSEQYPGSYCRWLRFLLYDIIPISELSKTDVCGMSLFNELNSRGHISSTNVTILSDISEVTEMVAAKQCVEAYKQETGCKEGEGLIPFRKKVFKGLMDVTDLEVQRLAAYYSLGPFHFGNVWDLVFHLQKQKDLDHTREKWETFARQINRTARDIVIEATKELGKVAAETKTREAKERAEAMEKEKNAAEKAEALAAARKAVNKANSKAMKDAEAVKQAKVTATKEESTAKEAETAATKADERLRETKAIKTELEEQAIRAKEVVIELEKNLNAARIAAEEAEERARQARTDELSAETTLNSSNVVARARRQAAENAASKLKETEKLAEESNRAAEKEKEALKEVEISISESSSHHHQPQLSSP